MRARSSCASSRTPGWRTSCAATSPRLPHGTVFPVSDLYDNLKSVVLERRGDAIRFHPTLLGFAGNIAMNRAPWRSRAVTKKVASSAPSDTPAMRFLLPDASKISMTSMPRPRSGATALPPTDAAPMNLTARSARCSLRKWLACCRCPKSGAAARTCRGHCRQNALCPHRPEQLLGSPQLRPARSDRLADHTRCASSTAPRCSPATGAATKGRADRGCRPRPEAGRAETRAHQHRATDRLGRRLPPARSC